LLELAERLTELVGTASGFVATTDALEKRNHLIRGTTYHQLGYSLGVAVTTAMEEAMADAPLTIEFHINELRACAVTSI